MSANAFAARQRAAEGQFFNTEERLAVIKRLERLVELGEIDRSALEAVHRRAASAAPTVRGREVAVYNYTPGLLPPPRTMQRFGLGTNISLGRGRWVSDETSIFSVADGKRMASTPAPPGTVYEGLRMAKIQKAALEGPTLAGYRLLPELTPGRAFLWGTILAVWGTGALAAGAARGLDIKDASDASAKLKAAFAPAVASLHGWLEPLRGGLSGAVGAGSAHRADTEQSELVRQLKTKLMRAAA